VRGYAGTKEEICGECSVKYRDPVTGDELSRGEYISWIVQGIIRRWAFLGTITALTILAWSSALWFAQSSAVLTWWNLSASYMALLIESVVGIAFFGQARRDAVVLREVRALDLRHTESLDRIASLEAKTEQQTEMLVALLEKHETQG
jgi:hypothetical protein